MTDYANMSIDEIADAARPLDTSGTIVMSGRVLAKQDHTIVATLPTSDFGKALAKVVSLNDGTPKAPPPPPPKAPSLNRRGRAKFVDPTNPEQIQGIAQRCVRHYILNNGLHAAYPKTRAVEHAKALKLQGKTVVAWLETYTAPKKDPNDPNEVPETHEVLTFG